jgi:peptidyl-prolyl cis-trans isomerase B (cyclophilin B)
MGGDQFDKRWYILAGFGVLAAVIIGIILISRGGGHHDDSKQVAAREAKKKAAKAKAAEEAEAPETEVSAEAKAAAKLCKKVPQPEPREETLPKPKQKVKPGEKLTAVVKTNCGTFDIALATKEAPITTNSFAYLAEKGFYDELTFHRIVPGFVIQGGAPSGSSAPGPGGGPGYKVVEEPPKNFEYTEGVVAMAKSGIEPPGTSESQFYVVTGENAGLPPEYAVVGKVSKGLNVVQTIGKLGTPTEEPTQPIVIEKMTIERG